MTGSVLFGAQIVSRRGPSLPAFGLQGGQDQGLPDFRPRDRRSGRAPLVDRPQKILSRADCLECQVPRYDGDPLRLAGKQELLPVDQRAGLRLRWMATICIVQNLRKILFC